jgi:vancomycin permeability regulator SanA
LFQLIKISLAVLLIWFVGHTACIVTDGLTDEGKNADVAVVLGSKVNEDGTLSTRLVQRLSCGLHLYHDKRAKKLFVSDGLGKEGFLEGSKMKEFLVHRRVPDSAVIVDKAAIALRRS